MLRDSAFRYGSVSRTLHWIMAALFAWQFGGMVAKDLLGRGPVTGFWVGTHGSVGTLLLILLILRALWALAQAGRRPPYHRGLIGGLARAGHLALYALMALIPALALLRQFGSGRPVSVFGLSLSQGGGAKVEWMTAPANILHGNLAWLLLALIAGHVLMVVVHRYIWRDDILPRMVGRAPVHR
ncbi:MAG: cytochrome b [Sphingobium sp.]